MSVFSLMHTPEPNPQHDSIRRWDFSGVLR